MFYMLSYEIVMCVDAILMPMTLCSVISKNEFFFYNHARALSS